MHDTSTMASLKDHSHEILRHISLVNLHGAVVRPPSVKVLDWGMIYYVYTM
jgi:hypothetical protein